MQLYEFQAKELLAQFGIPSPRAFVVSNMAELDALVAREALHDQYLKAQLHVGGRGKAGAILRGRTKEEILAGGRKLFGMTVVNEQTGPDGCMVSKILVVDPVDIVHEYYFGMTIAGTSPCLLASRQGGMEIETLAQESPESILRLEIFRDTPADRICQHVCQFLELPEEAEKIVRGCIDLFFAKDCLLLEINPLARARDGTLQACDAKITLDTDALFRHPELQAFEDFAESDPFEEEAKKQHLSYVKLSGDVGSLVNGAGLAMATVDMMLEAGVRPANFLDIGGNVTEEKVEAGLEILFGNDALRAIVIHIFGGIVDCNLVAAALEKKIKRRRGNIPVIVRLEGKNSQKAKNRLQLYDETIIFADSFEDIANQVKAHL